MSTSEDARTLAMLRTFLDRSHLAGPGQLGEVVLQAGREVG